MPAILTAALALSVFAQSVALPRAVPYLPQTEALCGGAAAAMVMRYWGAADARAEEFAPLVDQSQSGIVTTALVADLQRRGWQAFPLRGRAGDDATMRQHLSRGRPIISLIEVRPSRYHYVVITAVTDDRIHFHDPAIAPSQTLGRVEFDRRWSAANFWMLLLLPGTRTGTGTIEPGTEPVERVEPVAPVEPPFASRIATLLRSGDTAEALRIATEATTRNPADTVAWDALATTYFVLDRDIDALEAWNRAGKPDVDTVQIAGLAQTRFRVAETLIGLEPGDRLTPAALGRARRRLALLPSASGSRVSYTPLPDGRVQIDAAIVEHSRLPAPIDLALTAAKAPFSRDVEVAVTNIVGAGERVTGLWRFRKGFERLEMSVEAPAPIPLGAVWKLSGHDTSETYALGAGRTSAEWRGSGFQATDWMTSAIGWTAGAAWERWPAAGDGAPEEKLYAAARATLAAGTVFDAHVTAERWMRGAGATRLGGRARFSLAAGGGQLTALAGAEGVDRNAPLFLLPGAGDGHIRRPLLRAHPLVQDGAISATHGRIFGRRLLHGTLEWSRPMLRLALASVEGALFTDAARGWQLIDGRSADGQIDAGAGLRVRLLGGGPTFRLDAARGLRDGRWAITAGTIVSTEKWIF